MSLSQYTFYKVINQAEFIALGIPSIEVEILLQNIGVKTLLVTHGIKLGILYEGTFLTINLNDRNPFEFEGYSIYIDNNEDVWFGILKT